MSDFTIREGATLPIFRYDCTYSDGTKPVLLSAVLKLNGVDKTMTVDATDKALVSYQFSAADSGTPGLYPAVVWGMTAAGSEPFPNSGNLVIEVEALLPAADFQYTPSPREVAQSYLIARTRNPYGALVGEFTDETIVSYDQALMAIDNARNQVIGKLGAPAHLHQQSLQDRGHGAAHR